MGNLHTLTFKNLQTTLKWTMEGDLLRKCDVDEASKGTISGVFRMVDIQKKPRNLFPLKSKYGNQRGRDRIAIEGGRKWKCFVS